MNDKRVKEAKQKAIEENKRLAEQSGNKLTQTLNEAGELVGVTTSQGTDFAVDADEATTIEDVRNELFNSSNVVLHPDQSDHGLSALIKDKDNNDDDDAN